MRLAVLATLARRGLLRPASPARLAGQLRALREWGYGLAGELRSAAARDPQRIAIVDERGELSYGRLLRRAERLATGLRDRHGVGPGDRIGLLCRNHAGLVEAMAAAALLGADAVLVNTGLSEPQIEALAAEQVLTLLVPDKDLASPAGLPTLNDADLDTLIAATAPAELSPPERPGRTIVLTSGTTGTPKTAHRPVPAGAGPLAAIISRIPLRAGERMLIAAPVFHTWGYAALQIAIGLRATIVLRRRFDPADTVAALQQHQCTALIAVPVMLQRLLDQPTIYSGLRIVAVSGSALPGGLATRFMDAYGDILYNLYGTTEASWASIATPRELRRAPTTAGRPPLGTRIVIHSGQIMVGNDMTEGLVATGDLGHLDADGLLHVDGRMDDMIVSGGENVFPAEVEDLLAALPGVREVAVVGVPDPEFGRRLAAYVVADSDARLDADGVREHVRRHRARFCVPRDVIFLASLPRNATGKVVPRDLPPAR